MFLLNGSMSKRKKHVVWAHNFWIIITVHIHFLIKISSHYSHCSTTNDADFACYVCIPWILKSEFPDQDWDDTFNIRWNNIHSVRAYENRAWLYSRHPTQQKKGGDQ